jgi:2-polyprenyl-3-methyl-5-hydroxy-6-metoxy-1,4-benzoquinol methylase
MATAPTLDEQQQFWNVWNTRCRELSNLDVPTLARADAVMRHVQQLKLPNARILDIGCGTGWLSEILSTRGEVTAIDLAAEVIERAQLRVPHVRFHAGDVLTMPLPSSAFDLVVTLETIAHVADQSKFVDRIAALLRPHGFLILTTQNRFVFERRGDIGGPGSGQLRRWLNQNELRKLLHPRFRVLDMSTILPAGHKGILRLINSYKANSILARIAGQPRLDALKERVGLGQTIVVLAQRI